MIDIHCHILPDVDDGPLEISACFEMANVAVKSGITHLFATPHHFNGQYNNFKLDILDRVNEIQKLLHNESIPLVIHPGQELRIHREVLLSLEKNELLTLDNKKQYLLLELPPNQFPSYTLEIVYELLLKGITPIIVHPERNKKLIENPTLLFELVKEGALVQLTSGSIIGHFGKKIKNAAEIMMEHHLVHFIATDAHNVSTRGFSLYEAYEMIAKKYGMNQMSYFKKNTELLINGHNITIEHPLPLKKKFLGII